jgi:hypothetical protein
LAIRQADQIADAAAAKIRVKFVAGQVEHGGNLFRKPVLHEAIAEAVDMFTYLHVLADQAGHALRLLDEYAERCTLPPEIAGARNLLRYGNVEGERS